jgi:molybdopterin-guanine dinucleotide biosynthesis protein A
MEPRERPTLSAVILAGGRSLRMGRDKAWLPVQGRPLLMRQIALVQELGPAQTFISGRVDVDYSALGCRVLHDLEAGLGPLGGIERALHACETDLLLVLAVDLAAMTGGFLRRLTSRCDCKVGGVPKRGGDLEPLAAVYPKRCHALACEALARSRYAARDFAAACLEEGAVKTLPVPLADDFQFANWNRPSDIRGHRVLPEIAGLGPP